MLEITWVLEIVVTFYIINCCNQKLREMRKYKTSMSRRDADLKYTL